MRIGQGYDSHRFEPGRPLILGGVEIPHEFGLAGHSDADAVLHAVTDAILGAIAAGDIGELFSDTDPKWAGADSSLFIIEALRLATKKGFQVGNCDITVIAQKPKLSDYKLEMREKIASLLGVSVDAVSVKAKTNEGMGALGRAEGLAALAIVLLCPAD